MSKAVTGTVSGRVQGVSFRAWTQTQAKRLGLTGWVRNLSDGRVELVAQGRAEDVDALVEKLGKGPVLARVDQVAISETPYDPSAVGFPILSTV